ncbi:S8 family peptidase [Priestia aryabhattai]|uniref:S8 family peptidase n=1 Tax=Priestia aryabhattai TaxID=412384 RepID=UPI003D2AC0B1
MKKSLTIFMITIMTIIAGCSHSNTIKSQEGQIEKSKEYLVTFDKQTDLKLIKQLKIKVIKKYKYFPIILASLNEKQYKQLKLSSEIRAIEPNKTLHSNSIDNEKNETKNINQNFQTTYRGKGVKIAILDSGIDINHSDLNIKDTISFIPNSSSSTDETGHGTHVAGIIGAQDNKIGITGISPDADLYGLKVLNNSNIGKNSSLLSAIEWSIDSDVDIIHMSFSSKKFSEAVSTAIKTAYKKNIVMVASAGNEGLYLKESITYPGAYDEVIAVGSVDSKNKRSMFSSVGKQLEIMALGEKVYSTEPNNKYGERDGTSMAAPYVTGVCALLKEKYNDISNKEIRNQLRKTAIPLGDKFLYGNGLINPDKLLN